MRKDSKRGQAAMEFLMTYGWAILVVLVVIGALVYFMGPNIVQSMIPTKCLSGDAGLTCTAFKATYATGDAGTASMLYTNNYDEDVTVTGIKVERDGVAVCTKTALTVTINPTKTGTAATDATCKSALFPSGQKVKLAVTTTFYKASETAAFAHPIKGEVTTTVI